MGKSAAKYRLSRCRCKINNLMREETGTSIFFVFHGPPALPTPLSLLDLLPTDPYPALPSARSFSSTLPCSSASPKLLAASACLRSVVLACPTLLCSGLRLPEIAGCLGPFSTSKIASDAPPAASAAELQSHRRILALGLTERILSLPARLPQLQGQSPSWIMPNLANYSKLDGIGKYTAKRSIHGPH